MRRTLKSAVKDELTIPEQQRYLVGIELGPVERQVGSLPFDSCSSLNFLRQVYDQAMVGALAELGLDARGVAAYEGWQVDAGMLRNILRRLRGICTHPQVCVPCGLPWSFCVYICRRSDNSSDKGTNLSKETF